MKELIKIDIKYFLYSKCFLSVCLGFILCVLASVGMVYQFSKSSLLSYKSTHDMMVKLEWDVETEKNKEYVINEDGVIQNPLAYDIEQSEHALFYMNPQNGITLFGEICTLLFPIFAFIVSILLVSYDEKNKTKKLKVTNYGKLKYGYSKQVSGLIIITLLLIISFAVMISVSSFAYSVLQKNHDLSPFVIRSLGFKDYLLQIIFTFISAFLFFELGYFICNIFHCYIFSVIAISLFSFFLPPLFKYDFTNVKNKIERQFFDFNGVVNIGKGFPISLSTALIEAVVLFSAFAIINYIVDNKRSAYM